MVPRPEAAPARPRAGGQTITMETHRQRMRTVRQFFERIDHIDPSTKKFAVAAGLSRAWAELVSEALKCQLLCRDPCHREKGAEDRPDVPCGSYYKYWYYGCRCSECRQPTPPRAPGCEHSDLE